MKSSCNFMKTSAIWRSWKWKKSEWTRTDENIVGVGRTRLNNRRKLIQEFMATRSLANSRPVHARVHSQVLTGGNNAIFRRHDISPHFRYKLWSPQAIRNEVMLTPAQILTFRHHRYACVSYSNNREAIAWLGSERTKLSRSFDQGRHLAHIGNG